MEKYTNFLELLEQQRFIASLFSITCRTHSREGSERVGVLGFDESQVQHRQLQYPLSSVQL